MQYRRFGSTDLRVSEVGFGCARIGGLFQSATRREQVRLVRDAHEWGINFFDTADMYAQGGSERLLGEAFADCRDRVLIASKVGYRFSSERSFATRLKPVLKPVAARLGLSRHRMPRQMLQTVSAQDFSTGYISQMVEGSLRRLGSDYLDLYQLHSPPAEILERHEVVESLERLKSQGKIRYWGVACETAEDALIALRGTGISSIQVPLSLLHQEALAAALATAAQRGVGVIARQIFASGLLTRAPESIAWQRLASSELAAETRRKQLQTYDEIARGQARSLAELALKFVLSSQAVGVALVGMHKRSHLAECMTYVNGQDLTPGELKELTGARSPS